MSEWKEYQEAAADFFRKLGFNAEVEKTVEGIRGKHDIDVYVSGHQMGINFIWIIECKAWRSNIPKEKVLALIEIVKDIGADKGFLLSETGFQSGAIRSTRNTNITLTSLEDLRNDTEQVLKDSDLASLTLKKNELEKKLRKEIGVKDEYNFSTKEWTLLRKMFIYDLALEEGVNDNFPVCYEVDSKEKRFYAKDWDELTANIRATYDSADEYLRNKNNNSNSKV